MDGLGVRTYFNKVMVHINGINANIPFVHIQFVIGDYKTIGFQAGTEPNDNAIGANFNVTSVGTIVQNEKIVYIQAGLGNVQFGRTDTAHGKTLFYGDGFANGFVNFFGDFFIVVGDVQ